MDSYSVGLNGLTAAQKGLDIIGNNIANAATEGYHRQSINFSPAYWSELGQLFFGGGVEVGEVTRAIDSLLETHILQENSLFGQVSQELDTLRTVESMLGELSIGGGLSTAIDEFFLALQDLSTNPSANYLQTHAKTAAETMATQFRLLAESMTRFENLIVLDANNVIEEINTRISQIAQLNGKIETLEIVGRTANNLKDQRDQLIAELSELIGIETVARDYGVVDVTALGVPIVAGALATELEVTLQQNGLLGITAAGARNYRTEIPGGQLGGLFSLKNELLADFHTDMDTLALAITQQINQYHVQGVGADGSFDELTGWTMPDEDLADFNPPVSNGTVYVRVTDLTAGTITRETITVNASTDTLTTIAAAFDGITGLTALVQSSKLDIQAETNYKFDFLPGVLPEPSANNLTGGSVPDIDVSGVYTGTAYEKYTCTVAGDGEIGNDDSLQIEVRNNAGELVTTLNVGTGYAVGDRMQIENAIYVSFGPGTLNDSETFEIEALESSDTSGVLAATGINTFFSGTNASSIAVCSDITDSEGSRIAASLGANMTDNANALRMAQLKDESISSLDNLSPPEFYQALVTDIGQTIAIRQIQQDNIEVVKQNLMDQREEISGVNINDEAARMLVFEQMFQAMAKYINTVSSTMDTLIQLL